LNPEGLIGTPSGHLLISCVANHSFFAVQPATGRCERLAGSLKSGDAVDGPAHGASFQLPVGMALSRTEHCVHVCDFMNHCLRTITLSPLYFVPHCRTFYLLCALSARCSLYLCCLVSGSIAIVAGGQKGYTEGAGRSAMFNRPCALALRPDSKSGAAELLIADRGNKCVRAMHLKTG
jgi:hypothetical protein